VPSDSSALNYTKLSTAYNKQEAKLSLGQPTLLPHSRLPVSSN